MVYVDPDWYFRMAGQTAGLGSAVFDRLFELDSSLDVARSAGIHHTAGTQWAASFDQTAVDLFEFGCYIVMCAANLTELVHAAGAEHRRRENANAPDKPQLEIPPVPTRSVLQAVVHPGELAVGGTGDVPNTWALIDTYIDREWPDCDPGKISGAATALEKFGAAFADFQFVGIEIPDNSPPDVPLINDAIQSRLLRAVREMATYAVTFGESCRLVPEVSVTERGAIREVLDRCDQLIAIFALYPRGGGGEAAELAVKLAAARSVTTLLEELDANVAGPVRSNEGINSGVTGTTRSYLAPILGRYARQNQPIRGRDLSENVAAGAEGERRARIDPNYMRVEINGRRRVPDEIDTANQQITEVKNTNHTYNTADRDTELQILDEADYAEQEGYTFTLIVDNRTEITPAIQERIDDGEIELVREELDDYLPVGQDPVPFVPTPDWQPPVIRDP